MINSRTTSTKAAITGLAKELDHRFSVFREVGCGDQARVTD
jgi:hypothetical protein